MKSKSIRPASLFIFTALLLLSQPAEAAHPLITDDTGVQGRGKIQIEVNGEYATDKQTTAGVVEKTTASQAAMTFTYGMTDHLDIAVTVPYLWAKTTLNGATASSESGMSDLEVAVKWRLFEQDGLSFAFKPAVTTATGDEEKGLGSGKTTYSLFFITTKEEAPWAVHANLGYIRNENDPVWVNEEKNIWHVSAAAEYAVIKHLRIVANVGVEKSPEKGSTKDPAYAILGLIYGFSDDFEIDCGVKRGLTEAEADTTLLAGMTLRF